MKSGNKIISSVFVALHFLKVLLGTKAVLAPKSYCPYQHIYKSDTDHKECS